MTGDFLPYTTKITTPLAVWQKIARGEISGPQAMFEHLYMVTGDFQVMMDWDKYFGWDSQEKKEKVPSAKKTNMTLLLLPWIAIWVGLPVDAFWGGIIGLVACSALPVVFLKYKATIFEATTVFLVSVIGLLSVLGYLADDLLSVSYLAFGLMWMGTIFQKVPITAWYSMNDYGEEAALQNPIFLQTNRILTVCWGGLYLLISVWTYVLQKTAFASVIGVLNMILPALLGLFTVWFIKWYPRHYAAKRSYE